MRGLEHRYVTYVLSAPYLNELEYDAKDKYCEYDHAGNDEHEDGDAMATTNVNMTMKMEMLKIPLNMKLETKMGIMKISMVAAATRKTNTMMKMKLQMRTTTFVQSLRLRIRTRTHANSIQADALVLVHPTVLGKADRPCPCCLARHVFLEADVLVQCPHIVIARHAHLVFLLEALAAVNDGSPPVNAIDLRRRAGGRRTKSGRGWGDALLKADAWRAG